MARDKNSIKIDLKYDLKFDIKYDLVIINLAIRLIFVSIKNIFLHPKFRNIQITVTSQVGFAEFDNTADNRANIGGTIIGAPIVGQ